jgi:surfactin synthase thioesterase subunit
MKLQQNIHLICLPFSGGSGFAFRPLVEYWPKSWRLSTLTFPGRGQRINEPLALTMDDLLNDCWQQIKGTLHEPYVLFGHSLGATLAYLLAHKILEEGSPLPLHILLTGTDGPSRPLKTAHRYLLPKEEFKAKLKSYGGISEEILNDEASFDFFEPIIRADFQVVETWQYKKRIPLNIAAIVITGTEEDMTEEDVQLWQKEFIEKVTFKKMRGNHFFLFDNPRQFVELVQQNVIKTFSKQINREMHSS